MRSVTNVKYDHSYPKNTFKEIKKTVLSQKNPKRSMDLFALSFTLKTLVGKIISDSEKRNMWWAKDFFQKGLNFFQAHLTEERDIWSCSLPTDNFMPRLKEVA